MKKIFFISLFTYLFVCVQAQNTKAQNLFKGLVSVGMNAAQIDGDGAVGYDYFGAMGGVGTLLQFHKNISVSLEILYSMRGSVERRNFEINPQRTFRVSTDYVELPFYLNLNINNLINNSKINDNNINIKKPIIIFAGLSPGFLARYDLKYTEYDGGGSPTNAEAPLCLSHQPAKYDLSAAAGLQFHITSKITIGGKFSYSLIGIRPPCNQLKSQYHNVLALKATYIISTN